MANDKIDEKSETKSAGSEPLTKADLAQFQELVKEANVQRKSLTLLIEYIQNNMDKVTTNVTTMKQLEGRIPFFTEFSDKMAGKFEELRNVEIRMREVASDVDGINNGLELC